jgi:hypothetical protein
MPKDEVDPEDPLELSGMALLTDEDTSEEMAECFIEEFMRMGHSPAQVFQYFRNPFYLAMNLVIEKRGEAWVRERIIDIFGRWGRRVEDAELAPLRKPSSV